MIRVNEFRYPKLSARFPASYDDAVPVNARVLAVLPNQPILLAFTRTDWRVANIIVSPTTYCNFDFRRDSDWSNQTEGSHPVGHAGWPCHAGSGRGSGCPVHGRKSESHEQSSKQDSKNSETVNLAVRSSNRYFYSIDYSQVAPKRQGTGSFGEPDHAHG
jgi:hypothetical protein